MRTWLRIVLGGLFCVGVAYAAVHWLTESDRKPDRRPPRSAPSLTGDGTSGAATPTTTIVPETARKSDAIVIEKKSLDDGGVTLAYQYTGPIRNPASLRDLREAVSVRGKLGRAILGAELEQLHLGPASPKGQVIYGVVLRKSIAQLLMYDGRLTEAAAELARAEEIALTSGAADDLRAELKALRGIVALRRGEVENCIACVGPSSCIFPIVPDAAHKLPSGSREAVQHFTAYLKEWPGDLRVRWVLNIAAMTLGEYPDKVPPRDRIPLDTFRSKIDVGRFENVATLVGLTSRAPNMAGGSVFDDFNGDGRPDIVSTSLDSDLGASLFLNRGDGTFEDRSKAAGLGDQVYALNLSRADFDNDGDLDLVLLRGAWDVPMRLSLLRNKGDGTFDDVTQKSGLGEPISTEAAAWGDFDNDGRLDLFVCGEYLPPAGDAPTTFRRDPRNRCRLYRNQGDGTFQNVAAAAGVVNEQCGKGCAWGDYDADGHLDLFVSNMSGPGRLYHNEGNGTFRDVAPTLGVTAELGFACWFWDFDNDGRLDLFVNGKGITLAESVALALGRSLDRRSHPRLYRNLGAEGFREVSHEVGLDRDMTPMGCNFGDIDNDGFLDIYIGTGEMSFSGLVPNLMFKNVEGRRFEDVTLSSGTGHLQKGHGVSFADWDSDGDLDLFVESGGASPGDAGYNLLFQNPGHPGHSLGVKLIGTRTNRGALGARIRAVVKRADGTTRTVYRTIGNNSSFGGNSLAELIGVGDATSVDELEVSWPTSKTTQTFRKVAADQSIEITEGSDAIKSLPRQRLTVPPR